MSQVDKTNPGSQPDHIQAAKSALVFALLYLVMVVALWGYVYLTLLGRGMTQ